MASIRLLRASIPLFELEAKGYKVDLIDMCGGYKLLNRVLI